MTEIDSPLGKKTFNVGSRRVFTVSDESSGPQGPHIPTEQELRPVTSSIPSHVSRHSDRQHDPSVDFLPQFESNPQVQYQQPLPPQSVQQSPQQQAQPGEIRLSREESLEYLKRKEEFLRSKQTLSPAVKQRIEFLTGIGRLRDHVEIDGTKFHIQTLKSGELRAVTKAIMSPEMKPVDFPFEARCQTLARALYAVNDHPIENLLGSDDIKIKLAFIDDLDENVITLIHNKYEKIVNRGKKKFGLDNKEGVKEVVEAVKKS